ncbi:atlastin-2, partial [Hyalella azteca]|uniref:Atlastin-2 n=1 Tax=Hyalella azteca TaxID=294128 RepID=A0A979FRU7_HYAAZ
DSTFIFALTLLTSSVTVYNLMNNIKEDDLMNLQTFCTFGTLARNSTNQNSCAFQKLLFLVRDWHSPKDYPYGHQSGKTLLGKVLTVTEDQEPAHQRLREGLRQSFEELECYLMPHIGMRAIDDEDFDGRLNQLNEQFVEHLKLLVPRLLEPERLVEKRSAARRGQLATGEELVRLFKTYMEAFRENKDDLPTTLVESKSKAIAAYNKENPYASNNALSVTAAEVRVILETNIEEHFGTYVQKNNEIKMMGRDKCDETLKMAYELYKRTMDIKIKSHKRSLEDSLLDSYHSESKDDAISAYDKANQYASNSALFAIAAEVRKSLEKNVEKQFWTYVLKNVANSAEETAALIADLKKAEKILSTAGNAAGAMAAIVEENLSAAGNADGFGPEAGAAAVAEVIEAAVTVIGE